MDRCRQYREDSLPSSYRRGENVSASRDCASPAQRPPRSGSSPPVAWQSRTAGSRASCRHPDLALSAEISLLPFLSAEPLLPRLTPDTRNISLEACRFATTISTSEEWRLRTLWGSP